MDLNIESGENRRERRFFPVLPYVHVPCDYHRSCSISYAPLATTTLNLGTKPADV